MSQSQSQLQPNSSAHTGSVGTCPGNGSESINTRDPMEIAWRIGRQTAYDVTCKGPSEDLRAALGISGTSGGTWTRDESLFNKANSKFRQKASEFLKKECYPEDGDDVVTAMSSEAAASAASTAFERTLESARSQFTKDDGGQWPPLGDMTSTAAGEDFGRWAAKTAMGDRAVQQLPVEWWTEEFHEKVCKELGKGGYLVSLADGADIHSSYFDPEEFKSGVINGFMSTLGEKPSQSSNTVE